MWLFVTHNHYQELSSPLHWTRNTALSYRKQSTAEEHRKQNTTLSDRVRRRQPYKRPGLQLHQPRTSSSLLRQSGKNQERRVKNCRAGSSILL